MGTCKHERLRCTNNIFYCLDCGAVVELPKKERQEEQQKTTAKKGKSK